MIMSAHNSMACKLTMMTMMTIMPPTTHWSGRAINTNDNDDDNDAESDDDENGDQGDYGSLYGDDHPMDVDGPINDLNAQKHMPRGRERTGGHP